jgi:hypothetical protein
MSISGASAVGANASSPQVQSLSPHKHTRHQAQSSISDVDGQSSSVANTQSSASAAGHKVNILA